MKNYKINFDAITTKDEIVGNLTFEIKLPDSYHKKCLALHRLCVEYARLNNISCSFVNINSIREVV